jgi:hypothetical protein
MVSQMDPRSESLYRNVFVAIAALACAGMVYLSQGFGIIWDEWIQSQYGKLILRFFMSGGTVRDCLTFGETLYLYGGLFDTITVTAYGLIFGGLKTLADSSLMKDFILPHYFETRHAINALFGFTAILFTGLLGKELRNWRTALLSLVFILLSPRFFGNAMNNPKDIPFAMAYVMSLYAMVRFFKSWPKPGIRTVLFLIVSIALAINIKAGGLMLIGYLFFFASGLWVLGVLRKKKIEAPFRFFSFLAGISLAAYLSGLLFWPYGLLDPVHNPLKALAELSVFGGAKGELLFEGRLIPHGQTPWYYIPKWIFISVPLYVHLGILALLVFFLKILRSGRGCFLGMLLFATLFPPVYAILKHSFVYDSWRHFLFIYPPMVVLAATAWEFLWSWFRARRSKIILGAVLAITLLEPAFWMVRWHPHEYIYFNPLVGGLKGAYGRYETDYWGNSLRMASEWLSQYYKREGIQRPIAVRADGELISSGYYLTRDLGGAYVPSLRDDPNWDFWLSLSRGVAPQYLRDGNWPPVSTIHKIEADGVTLCAIIVNPRRP